VNLAAAWGAGMRAGDSVGNPDMDIYGAWEMAAAGPANPNELQRMGDCIHFLADTQRGFFEQRESRLRSLGFRGVFVTTAWKAGGPAANAANIYCDYAGGAIDRHAYAGGGVGGHGIAVGDVYNHTHLEAPGTRLLAEVFQQAEDKPFTVSEWHRFNHLYLARLGDELRRRAQPLAHAARLHRGHQHPAARQRRKMDGIGLEHLGERLLSPPPFPLSTSGIPA